jgi:gentisate 1,2-dioxygenase
VLAWSQRDIVSLPNGNWIRHRAGDNGARLFFASDRDVLRRLGVLREEWGAPA